MAIESLSKNCVLSICKLFWRPHHIRDLRAVSRHFRSSISLADWSLIVRRYMLEQLAGPEFSQNKNWCCDQYPEITAISKEVLHSDVIIDGASPTKSARSYYWVQVQNQDPETTEMIRARMNVPAPYNNLLAAVTGRGIIVSCALKFLIK